MALPSWANPYDSLRAFLEFGGHGPTSILDLDSMKLNSAPLEFLSAPVDFAGDPDIMPMLRTALGAAAARQEPHTQSSKAGSCTSTCQLMAY
ncbi:MAG: hypothetical protein ACI89E_002257 [Planctomycetota bacterium]|jgi:hypothetical protein